MCNLCPQSRLTAHAIETQKAVWETLREKEGLTIQIGDI